MRASWFVDGMPRKHVGSWTSCWKGLHPGWLLATRFISLLVMCGFLLWDISDWGVSIFMYYTEWTFALVMIYFGLSTVASGYGCWIFLGSENGETVEPLTRDMEDVGVTTSVTYRLKGSKGTIKLESHYAEEAFRLRVGFWGYLMQSIYQTCAGAGVLTYIIFWGFIVLFGSNAHLRMNVVRILER